MNINYLHNLAQLETTETEIGVCEGSQTTEVFTIFKNFVTF